MIPLPKGHEKPYRENPEPYLNLLHRLGSIRYLVLSGSLLTNAHIEAMTSLPTVENLDVSCKDLNDEVVDALWRKFPNLATLIAEDTSISDAGVAELQRRLPRYKVIAGKYE